MKTELEKASGPPLRTEADVLREEVLVARRASEITAELVVGQFIKMDEVLRIVEQKAAGEQRLRERLAAELRESERREHDLAEARRAAEEARSVAEQANRERGALLDEMVRQNQYLAALHDTTVGLISRLDVHELLEALVTRAGQLLNAPHGFIFLAEPGAADLECRVGVGALARLVGAHVKPGEGLSGQIWQTGQPLIVDDYDQWTNRLGQLEPGLLGASMGVPLKSGEQTLGAIGLADDPGADRTFGKEELEVLGRFAQLATVALDNARLYSAAQESQRRMADIIDFLPDATFVIDREGRIIAWNRAIEELTGFAAAEMLGKGSYEHSMAFYGERRPIVIDLVVLSNEEIEKKYAYLQRIGSSLVGEATVPLPRGRPAYLWATASALYNARGEAVGAIETIRDISDRKQAEEELRQAKAAAEAATQAKSAFLAMMSHEIRTPMNAVIGMSGLLLDTELTPEQRDYAETVRSSGDALLTIINDILDFSKIEAGKMDLERQPFDLRDCVESALDLMKLKASEKGLELASQIAPDCPLAVIGDVTRLRQILVNLLNNALKFTESGEVVVTVSLEQDALHFTVRDTGIGIPADRLGRLFQAFSQVDTSTARKYGGTGLGLAVSKRLSEMMGGTMWVESEGVPGKGSTFHFTIRAEAAAATEVRSRLVGESPELRGRSVLIVDDNATNRRILTVQTEGWGMQPRATGSPAEALEWVRQAGRFDLAIVDLHMPELDGIELAEAVRGVEADAARTVTGAGTKPAPMPLILLSSLGSHSRDVPPGLFAACLSKPIRASALFHALTGLFAGQPAPAAAAGARAYLDADLAQRQPLRILLAEDNVVNQKLAMRLLERLGYRADLAANGLETIQAVERQRYDVILMDVQMPEMDGLEATRQICARWAGGSRPRIIAMTANAMQGDREICLEAGMDDYVSKPIRVDELVEALARCEPAPQGLAPA